MQDNNSIPNQTFTEETPLVSPYAEDNSVTQAESLLKQVGSSQPEPQIFNPGKSNNFLFGKSVMQIFAIAAVLIGLIIGVAAAGILHTTSNGSKGGDGQALLASADTRKKDAQQQAINNSVLQINRSTLINQNFEANGNVLVQSNQDSANAFMVQNSLGDNLLVADTAGKKITIGDQPPGSLALEVKGDITTNGSLVSTEGYTLDSRGLSIGGVLVCTSRGCISSSPVSPSPTIPTIDYANLVFRNTNNYFSGINKFTSAGNVFSGDGSGLSALNAGNISSGTLSDTRLSGNVALKNGNNTFTGSNTFNSQIQAAAGINSVTGYSVNGTAGGSFSCAANELLQQAVISGGIITSGTCVVISGGTTPTLQDVYDASAPASVVLSNSSGVFDIQDAVSPLAGNLFEVGSNGNSTLYFAVNNLGISVTGDINTTGQYKVGGVQISSANLSDSASLAKLGANQTFSGNNTFSSASNSFTGNGAGLTNVNAAQLNGQAGSYYTNATNISTGTLSDARLSNNVALLNALQTFTGQNTFNNASNSFTGNGSGLTSLNATNISSGTLNDLRLSNNVTLQGNSFNGASQLVQLTAGGILPVLNGSNLTSLNASNISSGTLADARLSSNVALLNANNIFLGNNSFHLNSTALTVQDAVSPLAGNLFEVTDNAGTTKYFEVSSAGAKVGGNAVCTTAGNCTGVSGGAIGGSGTAGKLAKFTGSGFTIGDSLLSESGSVVAVGGSINIASGNTYQINGSQISSANLSNDSNLAKLNGTQTFTGANTFSNASNSFTGDGSGLTNVDAAKLGGQLPSYYTNATNISSGTLSDSRLSSNVALKNANNTFTGNNIFSLNTAGLAVQDALTPLGTNLFEVTDNAGTTKYFTVSATALQFNGNDVCTTAGNCTGVSGGAIGGSGTAGKIAKFTGSGFTIGDSLISDNGSTVTVGGVLAVNTITPTATLTVGTASQTLALQGDAGTSLSANSGSFTNSLVFAAPAVASHTITIPNATGTVAVSASGPLSLDAAGNLTCPSCLTTNGSGGGSGVASVNSLTGAITLAGTANQVIITPSSNTLTFSLPQDIATTSTPDFAGINIGGSAISSSNLSDGSNLGKLNGTQTFTGANTFSNASNSFTGDGSGLTNLNATNISSGTLNDARLTSNVALLNRTGQIFTGDNTIKVNSAIAFQVQNSTGGAFLNVNTLDNQITLNSNNSGEVNSWTTNTNSLPTGRNGVATVIANGYIYALGGGNGSTAQNSVYYAKINADGSVASWTTSSNPLPSARYFSTGAVANGYIYVLGGYNTSDVPQSTVYYAKLNADGSTGAWVTSTQPITAARAEHTTVTANGYIYVIGGYDTGFTYQSTVYYAKLNADGSTGTWALSSNSLNGAQASHTSMVANGYVYVIGGYRSASPSVQYAKLNADGSMGAWTANGNSLPSTIGALRGVIVNGYAYVMGGFNGSEQSSIYYAKLNGDGSTGVWTLGANNMPAAIDSFGSVVSNGYIYVIGGQDGSFVAQSAIYYTSTSRIQIAGSLDLVSLAGGTLTDGGTQSFGSLGGSITAGNISAIGDLAVQGQGSFKGNLSSSGDLTVSNNGYFGGTLAVGNSASVKAAQLIYPGWNASTSIDIEKTDTGVGGNQSSGIINYLVLNPTGAPTASTYLSDNEVETKAGNSQNFGVINALYGQGMHFGSGTVTTLSGTDGYVYNESTGTVQNAIGGNFGAFDDSGGGLIQNAYGIQIQSGTGNVTNNYGLYVQDQSGAGSTLSYNIYSAGSNSKNFFAGSVEADGNTLVKKTSATAFQVQSSAAAETLLTVDSSARSVSGGNLVKIGNSTGTDGATTILVIDSATSAPTSNLGVLNGGLFYNSTTNHINVIENGAVKELCNKTDLGCGSAGPITTLSAAYTNGASAADQTLALSSADGGGLVIQDASTTVGNLLTIQNNAQNVNYFNVTSGGISTTNVAVQANGTISLAGGATGSRPGSPTAGTLFYDTTTNQLLQYNGSKWVSDRSTATKIIAASNSTQAEKDSADYVATGTNDQNTINTALGAISGNGGMIVMLEGTYNLGASINMTADNVVLSGQGSNTILKRMYDESTATSGLIVITASNLTVQNVYLDGNKATYTNANNNGIISSSMRNNIKVLNTVISNGAGQGLYSVWNVLGGAGFGTGWQIINSEFSTNTGSGISIDRTTANIEYNKVVSNGSTGIWMGVNASANVSNNYVVSNGADGIASSYDLATISSNTVASNAGQGITVANISGKMTVSGNTVISNSSVGIRVNGNNDVITGNDIANNSTYGIQLQGTFANITGNTFYQNGFNGLVTNGGSNSIISNNIFEDNGGSGANNSVDIGTGGSTNISVIGNTITDTAGTGFAISVTNNATGTYLSNNTFSGTGASTISDNGINTKYSNQLTNSGGFLNKVGVDSSSAFQVQNSSGTNLLNVDSTNSRIGVDVTYTAMTTPSGLTLSQTTGGSLTALATYKYEVTAIDSAGGETLPSTEQSITLTGSNQTIQMYWTAVTGASGYKIYRTAANGASGSEVYLTTVLSNYSSSSKYSDAGSLTAGTATPPASTTAYTSTNNSNNNLQLSIGGLGTPTGQLYVSGSQPRLVGSISTGPSANSVVTVGNFAYVLSTQGLLQAYNISNPAAPALAGSVNNGNCSSQVVAQGHYLYVAGGGACTGRDAIYDISNPASPTLVSTFAGGTGGLYISGKYLYTIGGSMSIWDVSNPASPKLVGNTAVQTQSNGIVVQGRYAYTTGVNSSDGLQTIDVSNPNNPVVLSTITTGPSGYPFIQGNYLYVTDGNGGARLDIFDISTPASPSWISAGVSGIGAYTGNVIVQGRYLYFPSKAGFQLKVIDVSNPYSPSQVSVASTDSNPVWVYVQGRYAYVANQGSNTLQIFDIGGAYIQQIQTGGAELGSLTVDGGSNFAGDANIQGGLGIGQSLQVGGNAAIVGGVNVQGSSILGGGLNQLATPGAPTVTPTGTAGAQRWDYSITAVNAYGGETAASSAGTTATGNATLDATNYNHLSWSSVSGATVYKVYRVYVTGATSPTTTGLIGFTVGTTFDDTGYSASGSVPNVNTTGQLSVLGAATFQNSSNSTTAFQVQNSAGSSVLTIDTTNNQAILGKASSLNGTLTFANNAGSNTVSLVAQAVNPASSLTIQLPTVGASGAGQCVLSDTGSTTTNSLLKFGTCATGSTSQTKVVAMGTATGCTGTSPVASADTIADYVVTSCTSAQTTINSAITALGSTGGTVYLKEGTYIIDGSINLASNVTLAGAGPSTVLKLKDSVASNIFMINAASINRATIKDLKIDGNGVNEGGSNGVGIAFSGIGSSTVPGLTIKNINIENTNNNGIYSSGTNYNLSVTGSVFNNISYINFNDVRNSTFSGNRVTGGTYALWVSGGSNNVISDNTISGTSNASMYIYGPSNYNTISNNTITSIGFAAAINITGNNNALTANVISSGNGSGIQIQGASNTVAGNDISGVQWALWLNTLTQSSITGNTLVSSSNSGVYMTSASSHNTFDGNNISSGSADGFELNDGTYNNIQNNHFYNNGGSSIYSSLHLEANADNNQIIGNLITDTAGTGYAIKLESGASGNYLANNTYSGTGASSISDAGTGTIYANQYRSTSGDATFRNGTDSATAFQIQNAAGTSLLNLDSSNMKLTLSQSNFYVTDLSAPTTPGVAAGANTGGTLSGAAGTTYYYKITALSGTGESLGSSEVSINGQSFTKLSAPGAPNAAIGAAGNVTGSYTYKVTFITANGETTAGTASAVVSPSAQQVSLTAIPTGPTGTTGRNVYRCDNTGANCLRMTAGTTLANNTTTTLTDNTASYTGNPADPGANTATTNTNNATVSWTAVTGATGYRVYRGTAAGAESAYQAAASSPFTDTGAAGTAGTVHTYSSIDTIGIGTSAPAANLDVEGTALFKNAANSTTAFQLQDSSGVSVFNADTTNRVIGINNTAATATLDVIASAVSYSEGFESGSIGSFSGALWTASTTNPHTGSYSIGATSGAVGTLTLTKSMSTAGTVSFWSNIQSGCCATPSTFKIDGVTQQSWSPNTTTPWTYYSFAVTSGSHTYTWAFNNTQPAYWYIDDFKLTMNNGSSYAAAFNGGNVGIGTSAPGSTLEVDGTATFKLPTTANAFQVQNTYGAQILTADPTTNSVSIAQGNLSVSGLSNIVSVPTLTSSSTGGTLAAGTYYYEVSASNANGTTAAIATNPTSVTTTGSTSQNTVTWSALTNASGYKVYRSTNGTTWYVNSVGSAVTSLVDNGSTYTWTSAIAPPTTNTTGGNLTVKGSATFTNSSNSTSALDIQDASGDSILRVDSTDRHIGINNTAPVAALDVVASPPAPDFTWGFEDGTYGALSHTGGNKIAAAGAHTGSYGWWGDTCGNPSDTMTLTRNLGAPGYISFWAALHGFWGGWNVFWIDGVAKIAEPGGTLPYALYTYPLSAGTHTFQWNTGDTCDYIYVDDITVGTNAPNSNAAVFNGGNVGIGTVAPSATLETDGTAIFKAATNATSTFQIQNASGDSLFNADSTNRQITIGRFVDSTISAPASPGAAAGSNQGGTLSGASGTTYYYKVSAMTADGESPLSSEVSINGASFTALTAPTAPTVGAPAAGGSVDLGLHSYKVTFVTANGETTGGTASAQANVTTGGTQTVPLTAIPTGPTGTTARKIYRTVAGDTGNYLLVTTIANNTATTYNDTTADASLGAAAPASNTATTNTNNATITWSAVTGATGYRVYRSTASGAETAYQTATSSPFTDTGAAGTSIANTSLAIKGTAAFQNLVDTTTAFQVQNATGNSLLNVDSVNSNITLLGNNSAELGLWTTNSVNLTASRWGAAVTYSNGYVYVLGGDDGSNNSPQNNVYYAKINSNGSISSWSNGTNLPAAREYGAAVVYNGYLFMVGGSVSNLVGCAGSCVWSAKINTDGSIGTWKTNPYDLPVAKSINSAVVANGYLYVAGGFVPNSGTTNTLSYAKLNADGTTGSWQTSVNTMPTTQYGNGSVVANGYIYSLGGNGSSAVYYAKLNIDGSIGSWTTNTAALPSQVYAGGAVVSNGYVYVIGGFSGSYLSTYYYGKLNADGSITSWSTGMNSMPAGRNLTSSFIANGYIYSVQGNASGSASNKIYYASTSRLQIGANIDLVGLQGQNLADGGDTSNGSTGGSITAGNITAVGNLQVQGAAGFAQSMSVGGNLSVAGQSIALGSTNSGELQSWNTANSLPGATYINAATNLNGYIYSFGGNGSTSSYYAKLNADGSTGTWASTTSLPGNRAYATAAAANGYVYVVGGWDGSICQATTLYAKPNSDGTITSWNSSPNAIPAGICGHSTVVANGYIYALGGSPNVSAAVSTVYYAKLNPDGSTGAWQTNSYALGCATPGCGSPAARMYASSVVANGYVYVLGGYNGSSIQSTVYYAKLNADGSLGAWTSGTNALPQTLDFFSSVVMNGYVYVIGGNNGTPSQNTTYYAKLNIDGSTGTWNSAVSKLPSPRYSHASTTVNGYVYVVAGEPSNFSPQSTVYYASVSRVLVGGSLDLVGLQGQTLADAGDTSQGTSGGSITAGNITAVGTLQVQGAASFAQSLAINGNLAVSGTNVVLGNSTTGGSVQIGSSTTDATAVLQVLDSYNNGTDPTGVNGAMYYNTSLNAFRCYQNGGWVNCAGSGASTLSASYTAGSVAADQTLNLSVADGGGVIIKDASTSVGTAFQVQTNGGANILSVDGTNLRVNVGSIGTAAGQLYVSGSIPSAEVGNITLAQPDAVYVQGKYAYVTDTTNNLLYIYDVSIPSAPVLQGSVGTGLNQPQGLFVQGKYAYVVTAFSNFVIFDVSNPHAPVSVGSTTNGLNNAVSVYVQGRYAYVTSQTGNSLTIFDVANPANIVKVGAITSGLATPWGVYAQGRYVYIADYANNALEIVDAVNPASPVIVGSITTNLSLPYDVTVVGRYAYVASTLNNKLAIFDVSNPAVPTAVSSIAAGTNPRAVEVRGRYAYVANTNNLQTFDVSNPASPVSVGTVTSSVYAANSLSVQGRYAFVATGSKIQIFDIGGAYIQQLEAGATETGTLSVDSNAVIGGDMNVTGSTTIGQSLQVNGNVGASGQALFQNASNSATAFQVQNATGGSLLNIDSTNSVISLLTNTGGETQAWQTNGTSLPVATYAYGTAVANGYSYIVGGRNGGGPFSTVYYAKFNSDGSLGTYTPTTSLPATNYGMVTFAYNNYLYEVGGFTSNTNSTIYYAKINSDGSIGSWRQNLNLLPVGIYGAQGGVYNGYAYTFGGSTTGASAGAVATVYYAKINSDGTTGKWITTSSMPTALWAQSSVFANGYAYTFGGANTSGTTQNVVYYAKVNSDGTLGAWQTNGSNQLPAAKSGSAAAVMNGYVYLAGGGDVSGNPLSNVYYAKLNTNGSTSAWATSSNPMPGTRDSLRGFSYNGYMYAIGGSNGVGGAQTSVYYASNNRVQVGATLDLVGSTGQSVPDSSDGTSGTLGGSLIAANIQAMDNLTVQGAGYFNQGVAVSGNLNIGGSESINALSDNSSALLLTDKKGNSIINVSAVATGNLLAEGNFESTFLNTALWSKLSGNETTFANSTNFAQFYTHSLAVTTPATATNDGAKYLYSFTPNTTYTFSAYALATVSFSKFDIGANVNGSDVSCATSGNNLTLNTTFSRYSCTFTTGATTTASDYVFLRRNSTDTATARTMYFDGVQLEYGSRTTSYADAGLVLQNLVNNPSFESGNTNGWAVHNAATTAPNASTAFSNFGSYSMNFVTGAVANQGAEYRYPFVINTLYSLSFWMYRSSGAGANINVGYNVNGTDTDCATGLNPTATWTQYTCTFTEVNGVTSSTPNFYIKTNAASSSTLYIDGVVMAQGPNALTYTAPASNIDINNYLDNITLNGGNTGEIQPWNLNANALPGVDNSISGSTAVLNGYAYIVGGDDPSNAKSTVYYAKLNADGSTGVWNTNSANPLPGVRRGAAVATANGYVYVLGGGTTQFVGSETSTVYIARQNSDGSLGAWTQSQNSLLATRVFGGAAVVNGYLYYVAGRDSGGTAQGTVWYTKLNADGSIGAWQTATSVTARYSAGIISSGGYIYVVGGNNSGAQNTVIYAKPATDGSISGWTTNTNNLPGTRDGLSVAVVNNYLYAIGGRDASATSQSTTFFAKLNSDGSTGTWFTSVNSLPAPRLSGGTVSANGYIYQFGGSNAGSALTTVFYTSTSRLQVGSSLDLVGLNGSSLADAGSGGGDLTANNGTFVGGLQVQGAVGFAQSMSVGGNLTVNGTSIVLGNSAETGSWSTNTNSLPAVRQNLVSTVVNGYVYAIGGNNGTNAQSSVYYAKLNADGSTGAWNTNGASLPALSNTPAIASSNGYIYIVGGETITGCCGGSTATYYGKVNSDGSISSWTTSSNSLPLTLYVNDSTIANGYLYTIGGYNNGAGGAQSGVYYTKINADGSIGAWNTNANALPAARYNSAVFSANGYIYSIGGDPNAGNGGSNTVYYAKLNANGSTGVWSSGTNLLPDSLQGHTFGLANGYVYIIGGYNSSLVATQNIYYAKLNSDGSVSSWSTSVNKLPTTLYFAGEAFANGYFYTIGGNIGGSPSSTVYYTSTSRISLGGTLDLVGLGGQTLSDYSGSGGDITANSGTFVGTLQVQGSANFAQNMAIAGNLTVGSILMADSTNQTITLGAASSTPVILVLGNKNTSGDPTCVNGAMYYNSNSNQFRFCQNGSWSSIAGLAAPSYVTSLPGSPTNGQEVYYNVGSGVTWHLRYNSTNTNWEYLGGGASFISVGSTSSTSGSGVWESKGTQYTFPLAGKYLVKLMGRSGGNASGTTSYIGVGIGTQTVVVNLPWNDGTNGMNEDYVQPSSAGQTLTLYHQDGDSTRRITAGNVSIEIIPLTVQ